jgi:hypothetical protein
VRLSAVASLLVIVCIFPAYAVTTNSTMILNSTGKTAIRNSVVNITIQNSTLFDKLLNVELNSNNCKKNVTENCQIVSSKLDNLTNITSGIKNEVNLDDIYAKIGIGLAAVSLWFVLWVFFVQDKQRKNLEKLVKDVHDFSEDQKSIKEAKRKRYSLRILFGLRLIEYEINGMVIHQRFRDSEDAYERSKYDKPTQIGYYEKAQRRFLEMEIEYDTILEIFNETIENQYRQAWNALRTPTLYVQFDNSEKVWETINKIVKAFEDLRKSVIEYAAAETKNEYSDLFNSVKFQREDNDAPPTANRS